MADARVLRDLAEEVERLDGPNRETEKRIWRALNPHAYGFAVNQAGAYTGSIDAAAGLMPDGWFVKVMKNNHNWWVCVAKSRAYNEAWGYDTIAATEALARTACALRALAADLEGADAGTD